MIRVPPKLLWLSLVLSVVAGLWPRDLEAQFGAKPVSVEVFGGAASREIVVPAPERSSGAFYGIDVTVPLGRLFVRGRYLEGRLTPDGVGNANDLVDAELALGVRVLPTVAIGLGRQLRSFSTSSVRERWDLWVVRAEGRFRLFQMPPNGLFVRTFVQGWGVLSGGVNLPGDFDSGRGLEGGFIVGSGGSPITARFGYRVERSQLSAGLHDETLELLTFGLCLCGR